jgi:predicted DNA-binding transcriptional regulator AlpA
MAITINRKAVESAIVPAPKKKNGHTRAKAPLIDLSEPGRLRVAHLLALLGVSHSTFYSGTKTGRYPKADGKDGNFPYWKTSTIKRFLDA